MRGSSNTADDEKAFLFYSMTKGVWGMSEIFLGNFGEKA